MIRVRFLNEEFDDIDGVSDVVLPDAPLVGDEVIFDGSNNRTWSGTVVGRRFFAFKSGTNPTVIALAIRNPRPLT